MSISPCIALLVALFAVTPPAAQPSQITQDEAEAIATEAYIYGYPLVSMDMTCRVMTNVDKPEKMKAPMGQFANARQYPTAAFKDVTAPNADTLYSVAWLNLSQEPYVLSLPEETDRYYLMPMLDGWTNVFTDPGTRTTGTQEQKYLITGPSWKGDVPPDLKELKAPTNLIWILGRTYCTGTDADYDAVHAIQDKYSLVPLSSYGKPYTPALATIDPTVDMKTPVREQVNHLSPGEFFQKLCLLMKDNPPSAADAQMITRMKRIGLQPGQEFDMSRLDASVVLGIRRAHKLALEKILSFGAASPKINGWLVARNLGTYGSDYLLRAYTTAVGLGANLPQDAIYPIAQTDVDGNPLNGQNKYVLHFSKDALPPVKGFWSLTMYDSQFFFVSNPINRYTVSPRNALKYNMDGSLDFYLQAESPGAEKESNWLPAPKENFALCLRLYWPEVAVLNGKWQPPGITMVK